MKRILNVRECDKNTLDVKSIWLKLGEKNHECEGSMTNMGQRSSGSNLQVWLIELKFCDQNPAITDSIPEFAYSWAWQMTNTAH